MEGEAGQRKQIKTDFKAQVARSRGSAAADFRSVPRFAQLETLRKRWIIFGSCPAITSAELARTDEDFPRVP